MAKNVTGTPESRTDELTDALKLISEIVLGSELRTIKEFIRTTDEARQIDQSEMEQRMESALAKIREDAMAISADLRHTKADLEADRKKWGEEISNAVDKMQKSSEDMKEKIETAEADMQAGLTKMREQIESNISDLNQEHLKRFKDLEGRVTRCENESTARKNENNRLAQSLTSAAQSLVGGSEDNSSTKTTSMEEVDTVLNALDDNDPESKDDKAPKKEVPDFEAVLNAVET